MSTQIFSIDQVLDDMLEDLRFFLTPPDPPRPSPGVSVVSVTERPVGLGNRRGTDLVGPFAVLSLKGLRLESVVRFQYWGSDPSEADSRVAALQGRLAAAGDTNAASSPTANDLGLNNDIFAVRALNPGPLGNDPLRLTIVDQPPDEAIVTFRAGTIEESYTVTSGNDLARQTRASSSLVSVSTTGKPNAGSKPEPVSNIAFSGTLRAAGFLQLAPVGASLAERPGATDIWRSTVDYSVLYEFRYRDADGAESLISRIPIDIDSNFPDHTSVSDDMVRWDEEAAPALNVGRKSARGFRVDALSVLAFLPDVPVAWNGAGVVVEVVIGGTTRQQNFASVRDFLGAFEPEQEVVLLGGNTYLAGRMAFPNTNFPDPVLLNGDADTFSVSYQETEFDSEAVVYLRALG